MKKYTLSITIILLSAALSVTSFYSFGYLLLILLSAFYLEDFFVFKTYTQKVVLSLLAFLAVIPLVGLACWVANTTIHPVYSVGAFLGLLLLIRKREPPQKTHSKPLLIDRSDILAFCVALIPIVVITLSYMGPNKSAAIFQFASEGWDNGSHILMMESIENEQGYVYGPYPEMKNKIIQAFTNYPQAWHLATVEFIDGFGEQHFKPTQPIHTIATYVLSSLAWMLLACYLFVIIVVRLYESMSNKTIHSLPVIVSIIATSILIQSVVLYGSLASGFTNYIGSLSYILLFTALIIDLLQKRTSNSFILLLLFGTLSVISWFLTLPAILLILGFLALTWRESARLSLITYFTNIQLLTFSIICSAAVFLQLYIFGEYSPSNESSPLNNGVPINAFTPVVGVFPVSQLLFAFIVSVCVFFYIRLGSKKIKSYLALSIVPWLLLVAGIFFYQNFTVGYNSYYLSKIFGICLIICGVFLSTYGAMYISNFSSVKNGLHKSCLFLIAIFIVLLGTGQSTYGLNKLFQSNARTTYDTSTKIVSLLRQGDAMKNNIVVLRNNVYLDGSLEDYHGKLEQRVLHKNLNCAYRITGGGNTLLEEEIERLGECADTLKAKGQKITVITSNKTYSLVKGLGKDNIFIQNVPK